MNPPNTRNLRVVPARELPAPFERPHTFPELSAAGPALDARACIEPRTAIAVVCAWLVVVAGSVFLAAMTYGLSLAALVAWPFVAAHMGKRARAQIRGSGLCVGPRQLAPIHACVEDFARRLDLPAVPEVYVVDAAVANAFAVRFARRDAILLTDEVVDACLLGGSPGALSFVIGHELGHVALGHSHLVRSHLRRFLRWLSRLDELSADRVAARLVGSREDAVLGMALLCAGPKLLRHVDLDLLCDQAREVASDKLSRKVERKLTHPLTLNRLARLEDEWERESANRAA